MDQKPTVFQLSSYSFFDVVGNDSEKLLQGQITLNIADLTSGAAKLAAFCNPKGRVVSLFHIYSIDGGFRILLPSDIVNSTVEHIKKYAVFFKVEVLLASENIQILAFNLEKKKTLEPDFSHSLVSLPSIPFFISVVSQAGPGSIEEIAQSFNLFSLKDDKLWYWQLASNRIPWLTSTSVGQFLPHYLNLPHLAAVDFNKGCFTGQEIIARMQYKGKLKQQMQLLSSKQALPLLTKQKILQAGKPVGEVIAVALDSAKGSLILASLKTNLTSNENFRLDGENPSILNLIIEN